MRSKRLLRISLMILLFSIVAFTFAESVYADITELKMEWSSFIKRYNLTGKSSHPNADIKLIYEDKDGGTHDITYAMTSSKTDKDGNIDAQVTPQFPPGAKIIVYIEEQNETTYAMGFPTSVGGYSVFVSPKKPDSLVPYVGLTSAILAVAVAATTCIKRRIHRSEQ
jgi:hypothetical protein